MKHLAMMLMFCGLAVVQADERVAVSRIQMQRLGVTVRNPEPVDKVPLQSVPARVTVPPQNDRMISAPVAGIVERVTVSRGDPVTRGKVLLRLDSPELLAYQRRLLDAQQEFHVADARYRREKRLFQAGIVPKRRWLETEKRWRQAQTSLDQARRELVVMGMPPEAIARLLRTARLDGRLELRAPVAAVVGARLVTPGQRVQRADPLVRLIVPRPLWLELAVPVTVAKRLRPGAMVQVHGGRAEGRVFLVSSLVDPESQTVLVRAVLDRSGGLWPGRKLTARLTVQVTGVLKLPRTALVEHAGGHFVFVRRDDGFEVRPVTPLRVTGKAVYLQRGLEPDEAVAVSGTAALKATWLGVGEEE